MSEDKPSNQNEVEISRRKFLKWTSYVPPTVFSILASRSAAQAATCNPNACRPECNPNADCGPDKNCGPDSECNPDTGCNPKTGCNPPGN